MSFRKAALLFFLILFVVTTIIFATYYTGNISRGTAVQFVYLFVLISVVGPPVVAVDTDHLPHKRKNHAAVGVDLGVKAMAVLSNGRIVEGAKAYRKARNRLRYLNKELSRRQQGLKNWHKTKAKLAKAHYKIACIRQDAIHKFTTDLVLHHTIIGLEDLHVAGLVKNHRLAGAINDQSFGEIRRQITYKAEWYDAQVVLYPRFKASTSVCCECGQVHDMPLSKRVMRCPCGNVRDRDWNAAINMKNYAVANAVSTTVCGGDSAGLADIRPSETMPVKQEASPDSCQY